MRGTALAISAVFLLGTVVPRLEGQAQRSIIQGRVTDPSGAPIAGANVRVVQTSTNVVRETKTNDAGRYEVPGLFPDVYRIEASHPGFETAIVDKVAVSSGRTVEVDLKAQVGTVQQSVTVVANKELLDVSDADVNTVIGARKVSDLPIGQGNATYLMLMLPGADSASSNGRGGSGMDVQPLQRQGTSQTRFDGSPQGTTEYTLDGTPNTQRGNSLPGGGVSFNPDTEVVQEVRVQTSSFDASVGHTGGATVDLVLKAGTNQYHGGADAFVRDATWNANSWSANRGGVPRQNFTYRRWSFDGGGPVNLGKLYHGKNKTFFYYGFEDWSSLSPNPATFVTVPTAAELTGNFSSLLNLGSRYQLYDPSTAIAAANGRIERAPFAGNIIPASRIDPVAGALSKLWPAPNAPGTADGELNFSYLNAPQPRTYWASTLRVDHNLNASNKLFGRMVISDTGIPYDTLFGRTDIPGLDLSGRNRDGALSDVWTISPSFIGDFRVADTRFHWDNTSIGTGIPYSQFGLGALSNLLNTSIIGLPAVSVAGYAGFQNSAGSRDVSEIRSAAAHFTKVAGNHSLKFGSDLRWYIDDRGTQDSAHLNFANSYSIGPFDNSPAPPIGAGLADFLLGRFTSSNIVQPSKAANLSTYQGLYFQDDWRIKPRLTLNFGVRYEREGAPTERYNRALAGFALGATNPIAAQAQAAYALNPIPEISPSNFLVNGGVLFAGVNGDPRTIYNTDNTNFAPRVALAWEATNNTVVRAGYGIFYVPYGQRFLANQGGVPGFDANTLAFSTPDNGLTFNRTLSNMYPGGLSVPTGSALGLATYLGQNLSLQPFGNNPNAYNQRWEFSIQHRFGSNYQFEARYIGNHTVGMPIVRNLNALPDAYPSTSPVRDNTVINNLTQLVPNPFYGIPGVAGTIGTSKTIQTQQLLLPYPEFGNINYYTQQGYSNYNALQVELERSMSNGLTLQTSYTWSKTIDGLAPLNQGDPVPERVISAFDRPNIFRFMALYELPFGTGRHFGSTLPTVPRLLISGWQVEGMTFIQSGTPLPWGDVLFNGNIADIPVASQSPDQMFNVNAGFDRNPKDQLLYNLRTFPSYLSGIRSNTETDTDFSVIKNTALKEGLTLQFRAEGYNLFNQHFFTTANTTPTNTAFGTTQTASSPRSVQLGFRIMF